MPKPAELVEYIEEALQLEKEEKLIMNFISKLLEKRLKIVQVNRLVDLEDKLHRILVEENKNIIEYIEDIGILKKLVNMRIKNLKS